MSETHSISDADAALYDRQIRLWGFQAQSRLQQAHILLIGLTGAMTEVAKNVALAGVGALSLMSATEESSVLQTRHLAAQFLVAEEDVGSVRERAALPRLSDLNPRVKMNYIEGHPFDGRELVEFLKPFRAVCLSAVHAFSREQLELLDHLCRNQGAPFVMLDTAGLEGFAFFDANGQRWGDDSRTHLAPALVEALSLPKWSLPAYRRASPLFFALSAFLQTATPLSPERAVSPEVIEELLLRKNQLCETLGKPLAVSDELYTRFIRCTGRESSAVCSVVGGVVAQEIISLISAKDEPLPNFFLFSAQSGEGTNVTFPL